MEAPTNDKFASAASFWEFAIKHRLGKLSIGLPLETFPGYFSSLGFDLLYVDHRHAVADLIVVPPTRDPFDRLLLAQCQVENLRLVTVDDALVTLPLAWCEV